MKSNSRPIVLIHGLWNNADIFKSIIKELNEGGIEYYAPTLKHDFGIISIVELTNILNKLIIKKFGVIRELDIIGFSMGGIIGRLWIKKFYGYKRTRRFISIGAPHNGTFTAQLIPRYPFRGISEMKRNSHLIKELAKYNYLLENIDCISFYTFLDLMVFPGWDACLPIGEKKSLKIYKHRNLMRNPIAVKKIIEVITNY